MSYDPSAFFNPEAETVRMKAFVDFDNPFVTGEIVHTLKQEEKERKPEKPVPDDAAIAFSKI